MTYPPSGQPYYSGQPEQHQPQYGGYQGGPDPQSYPQQQPYGQPGYPQESYTTEPPMSGQPYSAQPYSAQPYSGPGYDAGYGQQAYNPGYQQHAGYQQHQQPYAPPQQTPSFVTPNAPRGNRNGMIAVIVGVVVLLLLVGGIGGAVLLTSGEDEPTVSPTAGGATPATTGTPTPEPTEAGEYPARIDLPQTVAGMTKVDNAALNKTANDTALQIKNATNADSAVAAYYAPAGDMTKAVGLVGATGKIGDPEGELDDAFSSELAVSGAKDYEPGPLGGYMRCGNTASGGQALSVCGWADGGSLVLGIFINRSLEDSATMLRQIRSEILKRG